MKCLFRQILIVLALVYMPLALADQAYPIVTYTCDKEADEVKVKNEVKWGDAGKNFIFAEEQGTYNPWDWVEMEDRGKRRLVRQSKEIQLECELNNKVYRVKLEPKIFNPNFFGQCGNKISVKVSVYVGEAMLIENKELEAFCHGNAPVIRGVKVFAKNNKVKFYTIAKHKFY